MIPPPPPPLAVTCRAIAASFRQHAQRAFAEGDDRRGDYLSARALAWEAVAESGDLTALERPQ